MKSRKRKLATALLVSLAITSQVAPVFAVAQPGGNNVPATTDWSKAVVESTIKRFPTAESLKGWGYAKSLYLYGEYLVYLRTHDKGYLDHMRAWIDLHIDEQGTINRPIDALDYMLPGNLLLRELWHSEVLKKTSGVTPVKVSVAGVQRLRLVVKNGGNVNGRVHGDRVDTKLSK